MKEESQLFRCHSPVNNPEDDEQGNDKHKIIQEEIRNSASFEGWNVRDKKNRREVDLPRAGKFEERDNESCADSSKEIAGGLALPADGFMDPFF